MLIVRFAGKKRISRSAVIYMNRASVIYTAKNVNTSKKNFSSVYIKIFQKKSEDFAKKKRPGSESPDRRAEATN